MPVVTAKNLHHAFADRLILSDASMSVMRGERVGLVGDNGAGKSTLSSILVGTSVPDQGEVAQRSGITVSYLAQQSDFQGIENAREYILTGLAEWSEADAAYQAINKKISESDEPKASWLEKQMQIAEDIERLGGWDPMHQVDEIAEHLGVLDIKTPLSKMSGGERRRVALAQVLVAQADFAILDEPTNHLDIATIEWLEDFLQNSFKGALLLITHDRYVLSKVVARTIELDQGQLFSYQGGWEAYLMAKSERLAQAARADANKRNLLRKELEWLSRSPQARSTKQKARIGRAESLRDSDDKVQASNAPKLKFSASRSSKIVATFEDLTLKLGERTLIQDFSLIVQKGERMGIVGPNGEGKTSLLKLLTGEFKASGGTLTLGTNIKIALFDQERSELEPEKTILETVANNREMVTVAGAEMNVKSYLSRFGFHSDRHQQKIKSLSGGERARIALAIFLLTDANVILLDEPTNDLDVTTLSALEDLLIETNATVIVVTHDRYFLDKVAQSVLSFEGQGKIMRYEGYAQAAESMRAAATLKRASAKQVQASAQPAVKPTGVPSDAAPTKVKGEKSGLTFTESHEYAAIMKKIASAEAALEDLDKSLNDPDLYASGHEKIVELKAARDQAEADLESIVARWEYLEEKN